MNDLSIIPECFTDTNLIETLVPPQKGYNHQKGCNSVAKVMREKLMDQFALGIIDKDKEAIRYLDDCVEIVSTDSLSLFKHHTRPHYIIRIAPAVDGFIFKCAEDLGIAISSFEFPDDLKAFTQITKQQESKKDVKLKRLFHALVEAPEMRILKGWVEYLRQHPYDAQMDMLTNIT